MNVHNVILYVYYQDYDLLECVIVFVARMVEIFPAKRQSLSSLGVTSQKTMAVIITAASTLLLTHVVICDRSTKLSRLFKVKESYRHIKKHIHGKKA